jgi:hypothetical protein
MKITIDTTAKTIEISEEINLADLVDTMKGLFPGGNWKEFKIKTVAPPVQTWYPYYYPYYSYPSYPYYGGTAGTILYSGCSTTTTGGAPFNGMTTTNVAGMPEENFSYTNGINK